MQNAKFVADEIAAIYRGRITQGADMYWPLKPKSPSDGAAVHTVSSHIAKELFSLANVLGERLKQVPTAKRPEEIKDLEFRSEHLKQLITNVTVLFWTEVEAEMGPLPGTPRFDLRQDWRVVIMRDECPDCGGHSLLERIFGPGEFHLVAPQSVSEAVEHLNGKSNGHTTPSTEKLRVQSGMMPGTGN